MITVWGRASSSNVQAVLWCLDELEIEYDRIDAGFTYGVTDTPDYLKMNPNGFVPTLQDGSNTPLFESSAINRYLANQYASAPFWPVDLHQRAVVDMWSEWAKLNVAQNFSVPLFWPKVRLAPGSKSPEEIDTALTKLSKFMAIADERLASLQYLATDEFTLADVTFGHILYRYYDIDIPRPALTHVARYYEELKRRKAFKSTVMVSYDELRYKKDRV